MKKLFILLVLCSAVMTANASLISLDFEDKAYSVNDTITANIYISELTGGFQPLIAGFSLELAFTSDNLRFDQVRFGDKLDVDPLFSFPENRRVTSLAHSVLINEVSLASPFDLLAAQNGLTKFLLASVDFTVKELGLASFNFNNVSVTNDFAQAYSNIRTQGANIKLAAVDVPEPSAIVMFTLALMLLLSNRLRKN